MRCFYREYYKNLRGITENLHKWRNKWLGLEDMINTWILPKVTFKLNTIQIKIQEGVLVRVRASQRARETRF